VATVVQGAVRAGDSAYRFGGEEMCVIAPGVDGQGAHELGERVRSQVAAAFSDDERGLRVTASIGVATLAPPMKASDDLVRAADAAVYAAKAAGRDRVYDAPA
jgi:diguanylate cyclase (GGDEF)-like protein